MKKISFEIPDADERGVSPVIGVILMVAITVILAAVIASFVLGFGGSVSQNVNAGVDIAEQSNGNVTVTWISQGNAEKVNVSISGASSKKATLNKVGDVVTVAKNSSGTNIIKASGNVTLIVTAIKGDTKTVIQQKDVTVE